MVEKMGVYSAIQSLIRSAKRKIIGKTSIKASSCCFEP